MSWQETGSQILSKLNINLSPEQQETFLGLGRIKFVLAGEGAGKSMLGALSGLVWGLHLAISLNMSRQVLVWVVGADFEDAHKEMEFLMGPEFEWLAELGLWDRSLNSIPNDKGQKTVLVARELNIKFETISGNDPSKIGRDQPDVIIGCEVGRWPKDLWERIYVRASRRNALCWLSGSPKNSQGWAPEVWTAGQGPNDMGVVSYNMPAWANRTIYPEGAESPKIKQLERTLSEQKFSEKVLGRPAPPVDVIFPEFKHLLHVDSNSTYTPDLPTLLFVDPGDAVYAVLFVQMRLPEIYIVDELYVTHWTHEQVIQACQLKPAWAGVKRGAKHVMDNGGKQHHMGLGSAFEAWQKNPGIWFQGEWRSVEDEIDRISSVLALNPNTMRPYLHISPQCPGLIVELGGGPPVIEGRGQWRKKNGRPSLDDNDATKALAYGLLAHLGATKPAHNDQSATPSTYLSWPDWTGRGEEKENWTYAEMTHAP